jgi:hypothetical protein
MSSGDITTTRQLEPSQIGGHLAPVPQQEQYNSRFSQLLKDDDGEKSERNVPAQTAWLRPAGAKCRLLPEDLARPLVPADMGARKVVFREVTLGCPAGQVHRKAHVLESMNSSLLKCV